jgi:hypothetical protein
MSLLNFVSQVQGNIVFNPNFMGVKATYSRRITDRKEGDLIETKTTTLFVSPQGNYVAPDKQRGEIGVRINVIWAKTADLKFDGEPFLPNEGDTIEYEINGVRHRYMVAMVVDMQTQTNFGQKTTFAYEDGIHSIMKINTVRME